MRISTLAFIAFSVLLGCTEQERTAKGVDDYKAEAAAAVVAYDVPMSKGLVGDDCVITRLRIAAVPAALIRC